MARFIGSVQGHRGEASRLGTPRSGITAKAQGWSVGGRVACFADGDDDVCDLDATGGSNGRFSNFPLARLRKAKDGTVSVILYDPRTRKAKRPVVIYKPDAIPAAV